MITLPCRSPASFPLSSCRPIAIAAFAFALASLAIAQTLYTPGGTVGNIAGSNVGVGTSSPGARLHVVGGDITITDTGAGQVAALGFDGAVGTGDIGFSNQGSLKFLIRGNTDGSGGTLDFADRTAGHVSRLFVAGNGKVGIGTTAPNQRLSINGNLSLGSTDSFIMMGYSAFTGGGGYIFLKSTGDAGRDFNIQNYSNASGWKTNIFVAGETGNVGIGTTSLGSNKLSVNGTIRAKEVIVEASPWPDDVFDDGYKLKALSEVAAHIEAEGHLPDVPSAATVAAQGVPIGEMQKTLLRKVEELTLYVIRLDQSQRELRDENEWLRVELGALKQTVNHEPHE